jgi:dipeptidyl-peptidase 4
MVRSLILASLPIAFFAAACAPAGDATLPPAAPHAGAGSSDPGAPSAKPSAPSSRVAILGPEASPITYERIARSPEPGLNLPRQAAYSPDGKLVTYLQSESADTMALFAFDLASKTTRPLVRASDLAREQKPMSREEELRRERQRQKFMGVTSYQWAKRAPVMLIPYAGDVFVRSEAAGSGVITRLTETAEAEVDPKICEGGERVAFVRGGELFLVDVATKRETRLTKGAPAGVTRGLSDFNGQEEFDEWSGFWLSPACDKIAYLEVDEREVKETPVLGYRGGKADLMMQKYPKVGEKNPKVRAGVMDLATQKTTWLKWPSDAERYLGRFKWSHDGKALFLQTITRDQKRLAVVRADPKSGETAEIIVETSPTWVDFTDLVPLERSPRFLWTKAVGGHMHLELRDADKGTLVSSLTSGAWDVEKIAAIDEARGRVLIWATKEGPLERHVYSVPLAGGVTTANGKTPDEKDIVRLTPEPGVHFPAVEREGKGFVDVHSALDRLPKAVVRGDGGAVITEIPTTPDPDIAALKLRAPETVTLRGPSGDTLYGAMLKPRTMEPGRRYPVVVMVYGGPGAQTVWNLWSPRLLWNHLADRGVVVFELNNRGMAGRGPGFEAPLYGRLGDVELEDQLAGLDYLKTLPFTDLGRVGIHGHSYGGMMTLVAMLKAPDRFHVGVAGAPVTDLRLYDTGYTERFMGLLDQNAKGYETRDLTKLAKNLKGKLFLIHSLMDENVHFQNTAHFIDALIAADKTFDLLIFPGERHGVRNPVSKQYSVRRIVDYLTEHL